MLPQHVNVIAGEVDAESSSFDCDGAEAEAGKQFMCVVSLRDKFFNRIFINERLGKLLSGVGVHEDGGHVGKGVVDWNRQAQASTLQVAYTFSNSGSWILSTTLRLGSISSLLGKKTYVSVKSSQIYPGLTNFYCSLLVAGSSLVECKVNTYDKFGNPSSRGSKFTGAVSSATDESFFSHLNFVQLSTGSWSGQFQAPALGAQLVAKLLFGREAIKNVTVIVKQVNINHHNSSLSCQKSVAAGSVADCLLYIVDENGKPTGDISLKRAFNVLVRSGGINIQSQIRFMSLGVFQISFTPTVATTMSGSDTFVTATYLMGDETFIIGGQSGVAVHVESDIVHARHSSFWCPESVVAGALLRCEATLRDKFSNKAGTQNMLPLFAAEGVLGNVRSEAMGLHWGNSQSSFSFYAIFNFTIAKEWQVGISMAEGTQITPLQSSRSRYVQVLPDKAISKLSLLECPRNVPTSSEVTCTISTFDKFENPSSEGLNFYMRIASSQGKRSKYPIIAARQIGSWESKFISSHIQDKLLVEMSINNLKVNATKDIDVNPVEINITQSKFGCSPNAIVAGTRTECTIQIMKDGKPFGSSNLVYSLGAEIDNGGNSLEFSFHQIRTGVFLLSFTPQRSTSETRKTIVSVYFKKISGLEKISKDVTVNVISSSVHVQSISTFCDRQGIAGSKVSCYVTLYDMFMNRAREVQTVANLRGMARGSINNGTVRSSEILWNYKSSADYDIQIIFDIEKAGIWTLSTEIRNGSNFTAIGNASAPLPTVIISPTEISAQRTTVSHPLIVQGGAYVNILLFSFDSFSNPSSIGSQFIVNVNGDTNYGSKFIAATQSKRQENLFSASFKAPLNKGLVTIIVKRAREQVYNSSIEVDQLEIDSQLSFANCKFPDQTVVAGQNADCTITTFSQGQRIGDAGLISSLAAYTINAGKKIQATISNVGIGHFKFSFIPTRVGVASIHVLYRGSTSIKALNVTSDDLTIMAGQVNSDSSVFECPADHLADGNLKCYISLRDQFSNPTSDKSILQYLKVAMTPLEPTSALSITYAVALKWVRGDSRYDVEANFPITGVGAWLGTASLNVGVFGEPVNFEIKSRVVRILPGDIDLNRVVVRCPTTAYGGAEIMCHVLAQDEYGNPSSRGRIPTALMYRLSNQRKLAFKQAVSTSAVGHFFYSFETPLSKDVLVIKARQFMFNITVDQVSINIEKSSVDCTSLSMITTTVAGTKKECLIALVDATENPIGNSEMVSALTCRIYSAGMELASEMTNIAEGLYRVSFTPTKATTDRIETTIEVFYNGPNGRESLQSPSTILIQANQADPSSSSIVCESQSIAGKGIHCFLKLLDTYGNIAGSDGILDSIAASAKHANLVTQVGASSLMWVRGSGEHDVDIMFEVEVAGNWHVNVQLASGGTLTSFTKTPVVSVSPAAINRTNSRLDCPTKVPAASTVRCYAYAFDSYYNPSSNLEGESLFLSIQTEAVRQNSLRNFKNNNVGIFVSWFKASTQKSSNQITLLIGSKSIDETTVRVEQLKVSSTESTIACSNGEDNPITAGDTASCVVYLRNADGDLVGDANIMPSIVAQTTNGAHQPLVTPRYIDIGVFSLNFVLKYTAKTEIIVKYQTEDGLQTIGSAGQTHLTVIPGSPNAEKSLARCPGVSEASKIVHCMASLNDEFGNSINSRDAWQLVSANAQTSNGDFKEFEVSYDAESDIIISKFAITLANLWTVKHFYFDGQTQHEIGIASKIFVAPLRIDPLRSAYDCPKKSLGGATVVCSFHASDKFGNPSIIGYEPFTVKISPNRESSLQFQTTYSALEVVGQQYLQFRFKAPSYGIGDIKVQHPLSHISGVNPQNTSFEILKLSGKRSELTCPGKITAGDTVTCTVFARDSNDMLAGEESLLGAFSPQVNNFGRVITPEIRFLSLGVYQIIFAPSVASGSVTNATTVSILYALDARQSIRLGQEIGIDVLPAVPSASTSSYRCSPGVVRATDSIECFVQIKDKFKNNAGAKVAMQALEGTALQDAITVPSSIGWDDLRKVGVVRYSINQAGQWNIHIRYGEEEILDGVNKNITVKSSLSTSAFESAFDCPAEVAGSSVVVCTLSIFDQFKNAVDKLQLSDYVIGFEKGYSEEPIVELKEKHGEIGVIEATFDTPAFGEIAVRANQRSGGADASVNIGVLKTIKIITVQIAQNNSDVVCEDSVIAGEKTTCTIYTNNAESPVGDLSFLSAIQVQVLNGESIYTPDVTYIATGVYTLEITPTAAPDAQVFVSIRVGTELLQIGGNGQFYSAFLNVQPALIDALSSVSECDSTGQAGKWLRCSFIFYDMYLNSNAGSEFDLGKLQISVQSTDKGEVVIPPLPDWVRGIDNFLDAISEFSITGAGSWRVNVDYDGVTISGGEKQLQITGGDFSPPHSQLVCPSTVPGLSAVQCKIITYDRYNNLVVADQWNIDLQNILLNLEGASFPEIDYFDENSISIIFESPSSGSVTLSLEYIAEEDEIQTIGINQMVTINVTTVEVSTNSSFLCQPGPVIAGTTISCIVSVLDSESLQPIGDENFGDSLAFIFDNGGFSPRANISFVSEGLYQIRVAPTIANTLNLEVRYDSGRETTMFRNLNLENIEILPALPSASISTGECSSSTQAGTTLLCNVQLRDIFGNSAGQRYDMYRVEAFATYPSGEKIAGKLKWHRDLDLLYDIQVSFELSSAGTADIFIQLENDPIMQTTAVIVPGPISANATSLSCKNRAIQSSKSTCLIYAYDNYGNRAKGSIADVKRFFAKISSSDGSMLHIEKRQVENGVFELAFVPLQIGKCIVSVDFDGAPIGINNPSSLEVSAVPIVAGNSIVKCNPKLIIAGRQTFCSITTKNANNELIGGLPVANGGIRVTVIDSGLLIDSTAMKIDYVSTGKFRLAFTPVKSGNSIVQVQVMSESGQFEMIPTLNIYPASGVLVGPGPISPGSTRLNCEPYSSSVIIAGEAFSCFVSAYDSHGNPSGLEREQRLFNARLSVPVKRSTAINGIVQWQREGLYRLNFLPEFANENSLIELSFGKSQVTGATASLKCISGKADSSKTRLLCPNEASVNAWTSCTIASFDQYGNSIDAESLQRRAFTIVAKIGSEYMRSRIRKVSGTLTAMIRPTKPGVLNLTLGHQRSVYTASFSVLLTKISPEHTLLDCPVKPLRAGQKVRCQLFAKAASGVFEGDRTSEGLFAVSTDNAGVTDLTTRVQYRRRKGNFLLILTPMRAGLLKIGVALSLEKGNININNASSLYQKEMTVIPSSVDVSQSSFKCQSDIVAGKEIICYLTTVDRYGNPTAQGLKSRAFTGHVTSEVSGISSSSHVALVSGLVKFTYTCTDAGTASIFASYRKNQFARVEVNVMPDEPNAMLSTLECSSDTVTQYGLVECIILLKDEFGNAAGSENHGTQLGSYITLGSGSVETDASIVYDGSPGKFALSFSPTELGNVNIMIKYGGKSLSGQFPRVLNVEPGTICAGNTKAVASADVKAGAALSVTIIAFDCEGNPTGAPFESGALKVSLDVGGVPSKASTNFGAKGLFGADATPQGAGNGNLKVAVPVLNQTTGITRRRLLSVDLMNEIGSIEPSNVAVTPGPINAHASSAYCPIVNSHYAGQAGKLVTCLIAARDSYGNPSGSEFDQSAFTAQVIAGSETTNADVAYSGNPGANFEFKFNVTVAGSIQIIVKYNGNAVGSLAMFTALISPGEVDYNRTSATCNSNVTVGATVTCNIFAKDQWGNPSNGPYSANIGGLISALNVTGTGSSVIIKSVEETTGSFVAMFIARSSGILEIEVLLQSNLLYSTYVFAALSSIESSRSVLQCPTNDQAGNVFTCDVFTYDKEGYGAGTENDVTAFSVSLVTSDGESAVSESLSTSFLSVGLFQVQLLSQKVGTFRIYAEYAGANFSLSAPIEISPGSISRDHITANCSKSVEVNTTLSCDIQAKDAYGNLNGESSLAETFRSSVTVGDSQIISSDVTYLGSPGLYRAYASPIVAGQGLIDIFYNQESIGTTANTKIGVSILASEATPLSSTFICPSLGIVSSEITCTVLMKDGFKNPTSISTNSLNVTLSGVTGASMTSAKAGSSIGEYFVSFLGNSVGNTTILVLYDDVALGSPAQIVALVPGSVSAAKTAMTCPSEVTTGQPLTCSITSRDSSNEPAGGESELSAFHAVAIDSLDASLSGTMLFFTTGTFQTQFLITKAGTATISLAYAGTTIGASIMPINVTVMSGAISSAHSTATCTEDTVLGHETKCIIQAKDKFDNAAGTSVNSPSFSAIVSLSQTTPVSAGVFYSGTLGAYVVTFKPLVVGKVTVKFNYQAGTFAESVVTVTNADVSSPSPEVVNVPPSPVNAPSPSNDSAAGAPSPVAGATPAPAPGLTPGSSIQPSPVAELSPSPLSENKDGICGDGALSNATEACDDGNLINGDGCSHVCGIETGFTCHRDNGPDVCEKDEVATVGLQFSGLSKEQASTTAMKKAIRDTLAAELSMDTDKVEITGIYSCPAHEKCPSSQGRRLSTLWLYIEILLRAPTAALTRSLNVLQDDSMPGTLQSQMQTAINTVLKDLDPNAASITLVVKETVIAPIGCGDGQLSPSEECDDNNIQFGDGCDRDCKVEAGWECNNSTCTQLISNMGGPGLAAGSSAETVVIIFLSVATIILAGPFLFRKWQRSRKKGQVFTPEATKTPKTIQAEPGDEYGKPGQPPPPPSDHIPEGSAWTAAARSQQAHRQAIESRRKGADRRDNLAATGPNLSAAAMADEQPSPPMWKSPRDLQTKVFSPIKTVTPLSALPPLKPRGSNSPPLHDKPYGAMAPSDVVARYRRIMAKREGEMSRVSKMGKISPLPIMAKVPTPPTKPKPSSIASVASASSSNAKEVHSMAQANEALKNRLMDAYKEERKARKDALKQRLKKERWEAKQAEMEAINERKKQSVFKRDANKPHVGRTGKEKDSSLRSLPPSAIAGKPISPSTPPPADVVARYRKLKALEQKSGLPGYKPTPPLKPPKRIKQSKSFGEKPNSPSTAPPADIVARYRRLQAQKAAQKEAKTGSKNK
jgi:cysteine-rich repeat protein